MGEAGVEIERDESIEGRAEQSRAEQSRAETERQKPIPFPQTIQSLPALEPCGELR